MNKNKKILITGSSGFIGFSLALNLLKKGHKILGYDSVNNYYDINLKFSRNKILKKFKNFSFIKGELEDQKKLTSDDIPAILPKFFKKDGNWVGLLPDDPDYKNH